MDQLRKSIEESEKSRQMLAVLRKDKTREGMIAYNEALYTAADRQHNIYIRLRLIGDKESVRTADEMVHVAEQYMGKSSTDSFEIFIKNMKGEIDLQLDLLTNGEYYRHEP